MKYFHTIKANPNQLKGKALLYIPLLSNDKIVGYNFLFGGDRAKISPDDCSLEGASFHIGSGLKCGNGPAIAGGCIPSEDLIHSFSADIYKSIKSLPEEDFYAGGKILNDGLLSYMENYSIQQESDKLEEELVASLKVNCLSQSDFDLNKLPIQKELEEEIAIFLQIQMQNNFDHINIWQIHREMDPLEQNPKLVFSALSYMLELDILSKNKRNYRLA